METRNYCVAFFVGWIHIDCDYTFLEAINTFKDCLQTVGTLCREGTKIICQAKNFMHYYLCCSYKGELLLGVLWIFFWSVSLVRCRTQLCTFFFLPVTLQDVSTTHFKFVFKCIINSIFPSSPNCTYLLGFLNECHIDFTISLSET